MRWSSALLMVVVGFDWSFRPVDILYMVFVDFSLFVFFVGGAIIHELFVLDVIVQYILSIDLSGPRDVP